jgi:hypothetical protein
MLESDAAADKKFPQASEASLGRRKRKVEEIGYDSIVTGENETNSEADGGIAGKRKAVGGVDFARRAFGWRRG